MLKPISRKRLSLIDEAHILFWRQAIRLGRWAAKFKATLMPIRNYLWLPVVALLVGMVLGILISLA